jgi:hypothetical protein
MGYNHGHNLISNVFFEEKEKVGVGGFKKKKKKKKIEDKALHLPLHILRRKVY